VTIPIYSRPQTVEQALEILAAAGPRATVLAGGQDVVPLMNQDRLRPAHLVDISRLAVLARVADDGEVTVGPLVTHAQLARHPVIRARLPLLADAAEQIGGGVQVRNRGTIGGSVCAANPVYDLPPCLVAAEARLVLRNVRGQRRVAASEFFLGAAGTALMPGELLVGVECPPFGDGTGWAYQKLRYTEGCYNIASAATLVTLAPDGTCTRARVVVGGVTDAPRRLQEVEQAIVGAGITGAVLAEAELVASALITDPISDVLADGRYRRAMAGVMVRRSLEWAVQQARGQRGGQ